jgi:hypothetical protein
MLNPYLLEKLAQARVHEHLQAAARRHLAQRARPQRRPQYVRVLVTLGELLVTAGQWLKARYTPAA